MKKVQIQTDPALKIFRTHLPVFSHFITHNLVQRTVLILVPMSAQAVVPSSSVQERENRIRNALSFGKSLLAPFFVLGFLLALLPGRAASEQGCNLPLPFSTPILSTPALSQISVPALRGR